MPSVVCRPSSKGAPRQSVPTQSRPSTTTAHFTPLRSTPHPPNKMMGRSSSWSRRSPPTPSKSRTRCVRRPFATSSARPTTPWVVCPHSLTLTHRHPPKTAPRPRAAGGQGPAGGGGGRGRPRLRGGARGAVGALGGQGQVPAVLPRGAVPGLSLSLSLSLCVCVWGGLIMMRMMTAPLRHRQH